MDDLTNSEGYLEPRFTNPENKTYVTDDTVVRGLFGVQSPNDFSDVAAFGFNVVHAYGSLKSDLEGDEQEAEYLERMQKYLDRAKNNQLRVLMTIPSSYTRQFVKSGKEAFINFVDEFKNHDALYGWYLYDEPNSSKIIISELKTAYKKVKELDSNHLVFISTWEDNIAKKYASGYDVLLPQLYFGSGAVGMAKQHFDGYDVAIMEGAPKPWIGIINTHDSKLESLNNYLKSIHYTSPKGWNLFVHQQDKENKQLAEDYVQARLEVLNNNLSNPFDPSVKVTNIPQIIQDQLKIESKTPDDLGGFENSGALPESGDMLLAEVLTALCHGSNGIFSWIWQSPDTTELKSFNYYTVFQYQPVRDSIKSINELVQQIGPFLNEPETDFISIQGPLIMRYLAKNNRKLLLVVKLSSEDVDENLIKFPINWSWSDYFWDIYYKKQVQLRELLTMSQNTGMVLEGPSIQLRSVSPQ